MDFYQEIWTNVNMRWFWQIFLWQHNHKDYYYIICISVFPQVYTYKRKFSSRVTSIIVPSVYRSILNIKTIIFFCIIGEKFQLLFT